MRIADIVNEYLQKHGYDGLYSTDDDCGCELADLFPCTGMTPECEPGYKQPCDCGEGCQWHIGPKKEPPDEA